MYIYCFIVLQAMNDTYYELYEFICMHCRLYSHVPAHQTINSILYNRKFSLGYIKPRIGYPS